MESDPERGPSLQVGGGGSVPAAAEDACPECGGSGRLSGEHCPTCRGTGRVSEGVGGG